MSDLDLEDLDFSRPDFAGLAAQARAAVRLDFGDVVRRADRRRRNARATAATALAVLVVVAGVIVAQARITGMPHIEPASTPSVPVYQQIGQNPLPNPTFVRLSPPGDPAVWDPIAPEPSPESGLGSFVAGDIDHLYVTYTNCRATSTCVPMLAASADRGRTWQRYSMPFTDKPRWAGVFGATGTTVIAGQVSGNTEMTYYASVDGGATWRPATLRPVDAIPAGWVVLGLFGRDEVRAYDPSSGDMVSASFPDVPMSWTVADLPVGAGIWRLRATHPGADFRHERLDTAGGGPYVEVSDDGGKTWHERTLPPGVVDVVDHNGYYSYSYSGVRLATVDGQRLLALAKDGLNQLVYVSEDGARTWKAAGPIPQDGPVLSLLPTREGPIIVETSTGVYRSTDDGATFTRVGPAMGALAHAVTGGYADDTNNSAVGVWLSIDGGTWTYVAHPPVP